MVQIQSRGHLNASEFGNVISDKAAMHKGKKARGYALPSRKRKLDPEGGDWSPLDGGWISVQSFGESRTHQSMTIPATYHVYANAKRKHLIIPCPFRSLSS